jgi:hypothetical protein
VTGLFFRLPLNKTLSEKSDPGKGGKNSKQKVMHFRLKELKPGMLMGLTDTHH